MEFVFVDSILFRCCVRLRTFSESSVSGENRIWFQVPGTQVSSFIKPSDLELKYLRLSSNRIYDRKIFDARQNVPN